MQNGHEVGGEMGVFVQCGGDGAYRFCFEGYGGREWYRGGHITMRTAHARSFYSAQKMERSKAEKKYGILLQNSKRHVKIKTMIFPRLRRWKIRK